MRISTVFAVAALAGLSAAGAGCHHHHVYASDSYVHASHSHVHSEGCGHFYWHGVWSADPHPFDCVSCAPAAVYVTPPPAPPPAPPPVVVVTHVHRSGCGHYFWHGAWWDHLHPYDCGVCHVPRGRAIVVRHVHGVGCGHYFWHGGWWGHAHPHGCCGPRIGIGFSIGSHGHGYGHGHYRPRWGRYGR